MMEERRSGVLIVTFQKGVLPKRAADFLDECGLTIRHWASNRTASVNVLPGQEEYWKNVLENSTAIILGVSFDIRLW